MSKQQVFETTKDTILACQDIITEEVTCPEWGVTVTVTALSGEERSALIKASMVKDGEVGSDELYWNAIIACTLDTETGERLFTTDDLPKLKKKNGAALERIVERAFKLCGIGKAASEGLEKN